MKRTLDGTIIEVANELSPRRVRSMDPRTMTATDNVGWAWKIPHSTPAQKEAGVTVTWIPGDACGLTDAAANLLVG
jgi:hypothetical protein